MLWQKLLGANAAGEIEFISSSSVDGGSGTSITLPAPSGIENGDLLVAITGSQRTVSAYTQPSGFSTIFTRSASDVSLYIATKVANNESGNYTFTLTASTSPNTSGVMLLFRGVNTGKSVQVGAFTYRTGSSTITASEINRVDSGYLLGVFGARESRTITTPPSDMSELQTELSGAFRIATYGQSPSPSGLSGSRSMTWSGDRLFGMLLQLPL